ncbi:MAG: winged helix-turn-helix transcriptional regulator [Cellulosilyticaceae bacterium]
MAQDKPVFSDYAYLVMTEIATNEKITQRELSRELGVSVGSINVLINKLVKEGLIKTQQVSSKQVLYMLTPAGMVEKTKKTASYLKAHYQAIYTTKEKIKVYLQKLVEDYQIIYVLLQQDEMSEILKVAIDEYKHQYPKVEIIYINKGKHRCHKDNQQGVIIHMGVEQAKVQIYTEQYGLISIDLMDEL